MQYGTLPGIYFEEGDNERELILRSYASNYLREEIQAEALTKNIEGFACFLNITAACATDFLDTKSERKRLVQHPKILFFDCGILNGLLGSFQRPADRGGRIFENLIGSNFDTLQKVVLLPCVCRPIARNTALKWILY